MPLRELKAACERDGVPHYKAIPDAVLKGKGEFVYCDIGVTTIVA